MRAILPLLLLLFAFSAVAVSSAAQPAGLTAGLSAFLKSYNVSSTTINTSTYTATAVNGTNYAIMRLQDGSYIVINETGGFSFVLTQTGAFNALKPYLLGVYAPNVTTIANLRSLMQLYITQSLPSINQCFTETGENNYLCKQGDSIITCLQNTCQSVPVCTKVLHSLGSSSPFAYGIDNLSLQYNILNGSENEVLLDLNTINQTNYPAKLQDAQNALSTLIKQQTTIVDNPLFPPPTNINPQQIAIQCAAYGSGGGPWYCYSSGFCFSLVFNAVDISTLQANVSQILAAPVTDTHLEAAAKLAAQNAHGYYDTAEYATNLALIDQVVSQINPTYNALVANMSFAASRIQNTTLSAQLSILVSAYATIVANGGNQNATTANATIRSAIANATVVYLKVSGSLLPAYNLGTKNTALITLKELYFISVPISVADLATAQARLNANLTSPENSIQVEKTYSQLQSSSSQISSISPPLDMGLFIKSAYGAMINPLLAGGIAPIVGNKEAAAPLYAAMLTLVFGIIVIGIIYFATYHRLKRHGRIRMTPRTQRAWRFLFVIMFVLVVIDAYSTYAYATGANSFLPISGFFSSLSASKTVYLVVNSTVAPNQYVQQCVNYTTATLTKASKRVVRLNYTGQFSCSLPGTSTTGTACFDTILSSGTPAIVITGISNSSIAYKGMYGTALYAGGVPVEGDTCQLGSIISVGLSG